MSGDERAFGYADDAPMIEPDDAPEREGFDDDGEPVGACLATVWSPDPQDCGDPGVAIRDGIPVCDEHRAFFDWAASQGDGA